MAYSIQCNENKVEEPAPVRQQRRAHAALTAYFLKGKWMSFFRCLRVFCFASN